MVGRAGREEPGQGWGGRGLDYHPKGRMGPESGAVTPEGHSWASPGAGSSKTAAGVELERRELHAAPGAWKG